MGFYHKKLSIESIREYFSYDHDSGKLIWLKRPSSNICVGDEAGLIKEHFTGKKYIVVQFCKKKFLAHRIIMALVTGEFLNKQVNKHEQLR